MNDVPRRLTIGFDDVNSFGEETITVPADEWLSLRVIAYVIMSRLADGHMFIPRGEWEKTIGTHIHTVVNNEGVDYRILTEEEAMHPDEDKHHGFTMTGEA